MKSIPIKTKDSDPVEVHYVLDDIQSEDIPDLSERFYEFVKRVKLSSSLNALTFSDFKREVHRRFTSAKTN